MTDKQSKALWLADELEKYTYDFEWHSTAAAELRRLHGVNAELVEALDEVRCDIRHMLKGHFVHLKDVEEELSAAIAKATGEQQ